MPQVTMQGYWFEGMEVPTSMLPAGYDSSPGKTNVASPVEPRKLRSYKQKPNHSIIGLKNPSLVLVGATLSTRVKLDFTTYQDRAIIQLKNDTGSDEILYGGSIRGKRVIRISGTGGFIWEYSDYDSIEKNGESFTEINSDYIINADQCKAVGDYTWKESQPHKMYTLSVQGLQYWLDIGDVYTLDLQYALSTGNIENISADVEVISVNFVKSVGTLGTTEVLCRVPSAAWVLTSKTPARLVGAGSSSRLENRSNIITVGSSTWVGQADYFCDGTDDHVEIQAAIDYLEDIGGGTINFTAGQFNITTGLTVGDDIVMSGSGNASIIKTTSSINLISVTGSNSIIDNLYIDGVDSASYSAIVLSGDNNIVKNCIIENKVNITGSNNELTSNRIVPDAFGSYIIGSELCKNKGTIIVASSTFEGDYQLRCDGTDDDIQIQQALDYLNTNGGGTVFLTNGVFNISDTLDVYNSISIVGSGATILKITDNSLTTIIDCDAFSRLDSFTIDGTDFNPTNDVGIINPYNLSPGSNPSFYCNCSNITIKNLNTSNTISVICFSNCISCINCDINSNAINDGFFLGYWASGNITSCDFHSNTLGNVLYAMYAFYYIKAIASCRSYNNSSVTTVLRSFLNCSNISSCESFNNDLYDIASFSECTPISSCTSLSNIASVTYKGFDTCSNMASCKSMSNNGSTTEIGFENCNSMQQCKSDDTTPYSSSYADAGTSYACADTPNGGFNS